MKSFIYIFILVVSFGVAAEASAAGNWRAFYELWNQYHQGDTKFVPVPLRKDPLVTDKTNHAWFGECAGQNGKHHSAALLMRPGRDGYGVGYRIAIFRSIPVGTDDDFRIGNALTVNFPLAHLRTPENQQVGGTSVRYPWRSRPYFSFPKLISEFEEPDFTIDNTHGNVYGSCVNRYSIRGLYQLDQTSAAERYTWDSYLLELRCSLNYCVPCREEPCAVDFHSKTLVYQEPYGYCRFDKLYEQTGRTFRRVPLRVKTTTGGVLPPSVGTRSDGKASE